MGRRCREFVPDHLRPSFFREEAGGLANQTGGPDLGRALRDEYILRCERVQFQDALTLREAMTGRLF